MSAPEAFQNPWELDQFLAVVERLAPERILEVGAMYGGTLWHWLRIAQSVTVVDDEMRAAADWKQWAAGTGCGLALLHGSSHDKQIVSAAQDLGPYDLVFIDADHSYEAVSADFGNYSPVAKVVALHDILPRPGYGVSRLWGELKGSHDTWVEICQDVTLPGNEGPCGVGLVWM